MFQRVSPGSSKNEVPPKSGSIRKKPHDKVLGDKMKQNNIWVPETQDYEYE